MTTVKTAGFSVSFFVSGSGFVVSCSCLHHFRHEHRHMCVGDNPNRWPRYCTKQIWPTFRQLRGYHWLIDRGVPRSTLRVALGGASKTGAECLNPRMRLNFAQDTTGTGTYDLPPLRLLPGAPSSHLFNSFRIRKSFPFHLE